MAGRIGIALQSGIASGTSRKTLIQVVAAANHAIKVRRIGIGFAGTNPTAAPALVELARQTDAGTMTGLTLVKGDDSNGDTLDSTAQHTATGEPTTTDVLRTWTVHPQATIDVPAEVVVGAGDRIGLLVTVPTTSVTTNAWIEFEE